MSINSRNKGNRFERIAASIIAKWTGKEFSRTPSSGGLQWKSSNSKGDIVCTTEGHYFGLCAEIKAHKEIDFSELLIPGKKGVKIREFWTQCKRDADRANKVPMLMMRYNGMPSELFYVAFPKEFTNKIIQAGIPIPYQRIVIIELDIVVFPSTKFFRKVPYKEIRKILKTYRNGKSRP